MENADDTSAIHGRELSERQETGPRMTDTLRLEHGIRAPGQARQWITQRCHEWHCDTLADSAALMISELVTNVFLHARTDCVIHAAFDSPILTVMVTDEDTHELSRMHQAPPRKTGADSPSSPRSPTPGGYSTATQRRPSGSTSATPINPRHRRDHPGDRRPGRVGQRAPHRALGQWNGNQPQQLPEEPSAVSTIASVNAAAARPPSGPPRPA